MKAGSELCGRGQSHLHPALPRATAVLPFTAESQAWREKPRNTKQIKMKQKGVFYHLCFTDCLEIASLLFSGTSERKLLQVYFLLQHCKGLAAWLGGCWWELSNHHSYTDKWLGKSAGIIDRLPLGPGRLQWGHPAAFSLLQADRSPAPSACLCRGGAAPSEHL